MLSVGLLDVDRKEAIITVLDVYGDTTTIEVPPGESNEHMTVDIGVQFAMKVQIEFKESAAVTDLVIDEPLCSPAVYNIDFGEYSNGDFVSSSNDLQAVSNNVKIFATNIRCVQYTALEWCSIYTEVSPGQTKSR